MKEFEYSIFIGRFSPFHNAHYELVKTALSKAEKTIIIIGSYKRAPSPKNPWSGEEREAMIRASLTPDENNRVHIVHMRDYLYNDNLWLADITQKVAEIVEDSNSIVLIGHDHDHSSYYLSMFPQWQSYMVKNIDSMPHATDIRYLYFTHDAKYKQFLHPKTAEYLENYKLTEKFKLTKDYFDSIRKAKSDWSGAPFPVIFHTVDSIVLRSGHVLCVRRGKAYGNGQIALPGGFLNPNERLKVGAIRELKEETGIKLSKEELMQSIVDQHVFDHPERSERGRTLTSAFLIDLKSGALPKVKGGDDADHAFWIPLRELPSKEEEFFEDHFHIINYFVGSPLLK